jgi:signal transduction histidine kinase
MQEQDASDHEEYQPGAFSRFWRALFGGGQTESKLSETVLAPRITDDVHMRSVELSNELYELALSTIKYSQDKHIRSITLTRPREVVEPNEFQKSVSPAMAGSEMKSHYRWRATAHQRSLSVRAAQNQIEFFHVPNQSVNFLSISEFGSRRVAKMSLRLTASGYVWMMDEKRLRLPEIEAFIKQRLEELVKEVDLESEKSTEQIAQLQAHHNRTVDGLLLANQNLLFKVVNEQEATKTSIARELHDTVLADLMMLKRFLTGDKELSQKELIDIVDEITKQLRDICNECTPKTLQEWGLRVSMDTLMQRLAQRTGAKCEFKCPKELPSLPELVELNIYRIFQECVNNVEKYARASRVSLECQASPKLLKIELTDNGRGFSDNLADTGPRPDGFGLRSMNERADLIRCFYPTKLDLDSKQGGGTRVCLELELGNN